MILGIGPYNYIAEEFDFLAIADYMGVKVFSVNELILPYYTVEEGELNPLRFITATFQLVLTG